MNPTMMKWTTRSASASKRLSRPLFHGPLRIGAPLAPRSGEEPAAGEARHFHREEIVARRHARTAVVHDFRRRAISEHGPEFPLQLAGALERSLRRDVVHVEAIPRPGDAPGHRVDRLLLAAVARRRARIEQQHRVALRFYFAHAEVAVRFVFH